MHTNFNRTSRSVALTLALAGGMLAAGPLAPAHGAQPEAEPVPTMQSGQALFQQGKRAEAIEVFRKLTEADPSQGGAWFWLGYTLHADGQLDQAIAAHTKAAEFPQVATTALYNLGCAHALQGNADKAFAALRRAIDAGMRNVNHQWDNDTDLESIRGDARWGSLMERMSIAGSMPTLLRFWVGDWDVYSAASGQLNGRNTLELRVGGNAIHEAWTPVGGGSPGESWNWYDAAKGTWNQVWVDGSGVSTTFAGSPKDGGILFEGTQVNASGATQLARMHVRPIADGRVQQTGTQSTDGGATWTPSYDLIYIKSGEDFAAADADSET
ncbi:MAG: hypothetical protein DHS20C14_22130 [Phycisphaeraceae bacterium]|nr:MAG: hypothetical protein DHS20C14_22130 [Phycisphaeraceae bacterium]